MLGIRLKITLSLDWWRRQFIKMRYNWSIFAWLEEQYNDFRWWDLSKNICIMKVLLKMVYKIHPVQTNQNYYLWEILELVLLTDPLNQLHETHQKATCTSNLLWYLICFATKATTFLWWQMISWWLPVDYSVSTTVGFFSIGQ